MDSRALSLSPVMPFGLAAAISLPTAAEARIVKLNTTMKSYGGDGAYLAIYLTDGSGTWQKTIRIAGASVGAGGSLNVSVDIADSMIDAGDQFRIDSAVEKENRRWFDFGLNPSFERKALHACTSPIEPMRMNVRPVQKRAIPKAGLRKS